MSQNKKSHEIQFPLTPLAAAITTAIAAPAAVLAQDEAEALALEEVIVTANKIGAMDVQSIPSSVQAIPEAMLQEMGALVTADYVRFMPAVNWINYDSGGNNYVIFRGINTTNLGYTGTQSSSIYLDEIPITATDGTQPDIRMMDVARVEALSGPQGTQFGAAAQAGTLRIITNKPDTSQFAASADVTFRTGQTSDPSYQIEGMINMPLVEDVFAIRIAAQSAEDGGFIDNVLGHMPDTFYGETNVESAANAPPAYEYPAPYIWRCEQGQGDCVWGTNRLEWGDYRNDNVAEENWNSAQSINLRISARWDINENWSTTLAYHYGDTESQGNNAYNPFVGDLETVGFAKNLSHSEWDMWGLTIDGDLGFAQFVSATSFYENQRTYQVDNTLYYKYYTHKYCGDQGPVPGTAYTWYYWENPATDRAVYLPLYCVNAVGGSSSGDVTQLPEIVGLGAGPEWQERFTQEIRLSHQGETVDWLAGLYYEDSNDSWNSVWMDSTVPYRETMSYAYIEACLLGTSVNYTCYGSYSDNGQDLVDPAERAAALLTADHYWDSRDDTDWKTTAVFGEIVWHATEKLDVTVGGRWFETKNDKLYIKYLAGNTNVDTRRQQGGFIQPVWIGNDVTQSAKLSEFVPKLSLAYQIDDSKMVYALYSEGYRVGGINRANRKADWSRTLWPQEWEPDKLKNYELGLKSRWAENSVQFNLTYFYMDWQDFQHEVVDPSVGECIVPEEAPQCEPTGALPWLSIVGNVGDAHSTGFQAELDWVPADRWVLGGNAIYTKSEIDSVTSGPDAGIEPGTKLPNTPKFQGSLWATYTWPVEFIPGSEMFLRGQYSYTGKTHTRLDQKGLDTPQPSFNSDAYSLLDFRLGLIAPNGRWQIDLFVTNVTDERAQVWQGASLGAWQWGRSGEWEHGHDVYTVRPREYGVRFNTRW